MARKSGCVNRKRTRAAGESALDFHDRAVRLFDSIPDRLDVLVRQDHLVLHNSAFQFSSAQTLYDIRGGFNIGEGGIFDGSAQRFEARWTALLIMLKFPSHFDARHGRAF
jgi:hypothetical protein